MNELKRIKAEKAAEDNGWSVPGQVVDRTSLKFVNPAHLTELTVEDRGEDLFVVNVTDPAVAQALESEFELHNLGFVVTDIAAFFRKATQLSLLLTPKPYGTPVPAPTGGASKGVVGEDGAILAALPPDLQRLAVQNPTVRDALVKQRVGQDKFREGLEIVWGNRCPVTGIDHHSFLVASHIKPWADSDDRERLDPHNGILLAVHIDRLFDGGWITFDTVGIMVLSPQLPPALAAQLLLGASTAALCLKPAHEPYLAYHRAKVFKSGTV
jgi:hypothetical protein